MRDVSVDDLRAAVVDCIERTAFTLGRRELEALTEAQSRETSRSGRAIRAQLLDNAEIAQVMGKSAGNIRVLQMRAIRELRRRYDEGTA